MTVNSRRKPLQVPRSALTLPRAAQPSLSAHTSVIKHGPREHLLVYLLLGLTAAASNVCLLNFYVSLTNGQGTNIVSIRDVLLATVLLLCIIGVSGSSYRPQQKSPIRSSSLFLLSILVPLALVVGVLRGNALVRILIELVSFAAWALPAFVPRIVRTATIINRFVGGAIVLALLMGCGVYIETFTHMDIRVVTNPFVVFSDNVRPYPQWAIMALGETYLLIRLLAGKLSGKHQITHITMFLFLGVAILLTQTRTILVSVVGAVTVFVILSLCKGNSSPLRRFSVLLLLASLTWAPTMWIGTSVVGSSFESMFENRYSVLTDSSAAKDYTDDEGRLLEAVAAVDRWRDWAIAGMGLAAPYRPLLYLSDKFGDVPDDDGTGAHDIFVFFATRFGILGLLFMGYYHVVIFRILSRTLNHKSRAALDGQCLAAGAVAMLIGSWAGNIFASPYGAPVAMASISMLAAYEQLQRPLCKADATVQRLLRPTVLKSPV